MATTRMSELVQHLRAVALHDVAGTTDGQLLERFVKQRDAAAVAGLVRRHGPMVWGVCRRVLHNHQDAEDAFQAAFLVLVRRATSVVPREAVGNWLYGVAYQTALKARATIMRRKVREKQVEDMPEPTVDEQALWGELRPVLDQELSRLPDKYRVAVVLCDLEGKTRREVAGQLGLSEGTLSGRLTRGRAMLAKRLARRGLLITAVGLAGALAHNVASASVPTAVASSTIKAVSLFAAGQLATVGSVSVRVASLTEGVLRTMMLARVKQTALVLLILCVFGMGVGGGVFALQGVAQAQQPTGQKAGGTSASGLNAADQPNLNERLTSLQRQLEVLENQMRLVAKELESLRQELKPIAARPASKDEIKLFTLQNATADDTAKTLAQLFVSKLGGDFQQRGQSAEKGLRIATDARTNTIIVQGSAEELKVVEAIIMRLDEHPTPAKEKKKGN